MKILAVALAFCAVLNLSVAKEQEMINFDKMPHARHHSGALSKEQQALVTVAVLTVAGEQDRLKIALQDALKTGLSVSAIREILSHQSAYIGFPLGLNGLGVFNDLIKEREAAGIKDNIGKDAAPLSADTDFYALGTAVQKYIFGGDFSKIVLFDAPAVDHGLKAYLFGYLFSRDNLSFVDRELTTISTLCALNNVGMQLKAHLAGGKNLGLKDENFEQIFKIVQNELGDQKADRAREILKSIK